MYVCVYLDMPHSQTSLALKSATTSKVKVYMYIYVHICMYIYVCMYIYICIFRHDSFIDVRSP